MRRRPADYQPRKRKKKPKQTKELEQQPYPFDDFAADRLPFLLELNPGLLIFSFRLSYMFPNYFFSYSEFTLLDGSDIINGLPKKHFLHPNMTEVGCERSHASGTRQYLQVIV